MTLVKFLYLLLGVYWLIVALLLVVWRRLIHGNYLQSESTAVIRRVAYPLEQEGRRRYNHLLFWMLLLAFEPAYAALSYTRFRAPGTAWWLTITTVALSLIAVVNAYRQVRVIHRLNHARDARLAVAQWLLEHVSPEHRVFNDVRTEGGSRIDYVLAGPQGLFAIRTSAGEGRREDRGSGDRIVVVNGAHLMFPGDEENTRDIAEALANAKWLQRWLAERQGDLVEVLPLLVLPGWRIKCMKEGPVPVINETGLHCLFTGKRLLQPTLIHRVANGLERYCGPGDDYGRPLSASHASGSLLTDGSG